jgi:outer membrane protein
MNKLAFPIAIVSLLACIIMFFYFSKGPDLGYVDVNKLLEGYDRTKAEREAFNKKSAEMKSEVDSLIGSWQIELKTYEKDLASMKKKEVEEKKIQLQNKQQQISKYQQIIQKQIQEEDQKMTQTLINDINDFVMEYGKENEYRFIYGASGSGNLMYASKEFDKTKEILDGLNKRFNGK